MAFPPVPNYSKSRIDRAGQDITVTKSGSKRYQEALEIINAWRVCHAYPINTFNSTLREKVGGYKDAIVAQRLKRLPTIIDKLKRYPSMSLSRMQDIGGVRGIVNSIEQVRELQKQYQDKRRFTHELVNEKDYIANPKSDGYRGVHLVYRYNNTLARNSKATHYKGLLLELQLRTKLQHTWATAVETMGTFRGEALKSRQGSKEWLHFFAAISSAFAHIENMPPIPQFSHLSASQTFMEVARIEKKLQVLEQIRGLAIAANHIHASGYGGFYNLIILNSEQHTVRVKSYKFEDLVSASNDYAAAEAQAAGGAKIEPVLVSAGRLRSLRQAYPNYFLDVRDFIENVEIIIQKARETRDGLAP